MVLGGGEAETSLEPARRAGDTDHLDLSYDPERDRSRLLTGERERETERGRRLRVRLLERLDEALEAESESESEPLESLESLPDELLSLESEAELSLDPDDERLKRSVRRVPSLEVIQGAHDRLLRLSFCLSLRIFAAKPDSIASGAFEVTD